MSGTNLIPDASVPHRGTIINAVDPSKQEMITRRRGKLVFCVDDDHNIRQIVKHCLTDAGYPVLVCRDGPTCLALLARYEPRLVLLDMEMPDMDGVQTMVEMRRRFPDRKTKVLFLTGRRTFGDVMLAREHGADDYIIKPFTRGSLIRRLDHWALAPTTAL